MRRWLPVVMLIYGVACRPGLSTRERIIRWPDWRHFIYQDHSDTIAVYLDEDAKQLSYTTFWSRLISEGWALKLRLVKGDKPVKQLSPTSISELVGKTVNLQGFDKRYYPGVPDMQAERLVLVFLVPGCSACLSLCNDLKEVKAKYPGVKWVYFTDKSWRGMDAYLEKNKIPGCLLMRDDFDPHMKKNMTWCSPAMFLLDEKGIIKEIHLGTLAVSGLRDLLDTKLTRLLQ